MQPDKPDETDKRLAEMNGALTALETARVHIAVLRMEVTKERKVTLSGWAADLREVQKGLRGMVGKEDF